MVRLPYEEMAGQAIKQNGKNELETAGAPHEEQDPLPHRRRMQQRRGHSHRLRGRIGERLRGRGDGVAERPRRWDRIVSNWLPRDLQRRIFMKADTIFESRSTEPREVGRLPRHSKIALEAMLLGGKGTIHGEVTVTEPVKASRPPERIVCRRIDSRRWTDTEQPTPSVTPDRQIGASPARRPSTARSRPLVATRRGRAAKSGMLRDQPATDERRRILLGSHVRLAERLVDATQQMDDDDRMLVQIVAGQARPLAQSPLHLRSERPSKVVGRLVKRALPAPQRYWHVDGHVETQHSAVPKAQRVRSNLSRWPIDAIERASEQGTKDTSSRRDADGRPRRAHRRVYRRSRYKCQMPIRRRGV